MRVSSSGTETLNASDVKWDDPESLKGLVFRQKPGDGNALGHVKFLFPNQVQRLPARHAGRFAVRETGRAFSHGCVRVEEPETLAKYVLKDYPEWDEQTIFARCAPASRSTSS
jgi:murein L,D-transpeptidase YcbB/YkuD